MRGNLFGWAPNGWQRAILILGGVIFALGAFSRLTSYDGDSPTAPALIAVVMLFLASARRDKSNHPRPAVIPEDELKKAAGAFQADLDNALERFSEYREELLGTHEGFLFSQADCQGYVDQADCDGSAAAMGNTFSSHRSDIFGAIETQLSEWADGLDAHKEVHAAIERRLDEFWNELVAEATRISARMKARFPRVKA